METVFAAVAATDRSRANLRFAAPRRGVAQELAAGERTHRLSPNIYVTGGDRSTKRAVAAVWQTGWTDFSRFNGTPRRPALAGGVRREHMARAPNLPAKRPPARGWEKRDHTASFKFVVVVSHQAAVNALNHFVKLERPLRI